MGRYVLTIRVVRPTRFTAIERSYDSDGHLLVASGAPPAPTLALAPDLSPASWPKEELSHYAALVTSLAQIALNAGATVSYAGVLAMTCYDAVTGKVHSLNAAYNVPGKESNPLSIPRFEPSGRSALVPGFMAGVQAAHDRFGRLPFGALFDPVIHFAQEGFRVSGALAGRIATNGSILSRLPEARRVFTKGDGELYSEGDWFRQPELAETLRTVATEGAGYMYRGPWADKFVELVQRRPEIHHSDQGVQYAAQGYVDRLQALGTQISMAAVGQPTQNPYAERVIRTIKEEEVYLNEYEDFADAYQRIGHFIEDVYQTKRIHSALDYLTPAEFEALYQVGSGP